MLIAIIPVALIVLIGYLFYKKLIYKTKEQGIQELLYNLNSACPKGYMVKYKYHDGLDGDAYVIYKGDNEIIGAYDGLHIMYFIAGITEELKKSKDKDDTIILEKLIHSNHREITKDLMNHIDAYNSFAKYLRLNYKDHDKYDKKIYEYYDALGDQNQITSCRLLIFSHITEQQIQKV